MDPASVRAFADDVVALSVAFTEIQRVLDKFGVMDGRQIIKKILSCNFPKFNPSTSCDLIDYILRLSRRYSTRLS